MLIGIKNLSLSYLHKPLFQDLSFSIERGCLLVLIGANGCGKSTLLHLLVSRAGSGNTHEVEADLQINGDITLAPNLRLSLLPQNLHEIQSGLKSLESLTGRQAGRAARLRELFELFNDDDGWEFLSDGERQKRTIINTLLTDSNLYLLDEPTNYLDIAGITAFEQEIAALKENGKGIIMVTHDRTLADNLADQTILIGHDGIFQTRGGASAAWAIKSDSVHSRLKRSKDIKKKIRQLQNDIVAKSGWAAAKERQIIGAGGAKGHISKLSKKMAKRAKVAERRAEKEIEKLKSTKPFIPKQVHLAFPEYEIRNRQVFSLQEVSFSYEPQPKTRADELLSDITIDAGTRDKFCLMGANGSGKTTILKLAQGLLKPITGSVQLNRNVKTVHVPQGLVNFYRRDRFIDNFRDTDHDETTIRRFLGGALIRKEKVNDSIDQFSYGELMRAAIVKCILARAEFLFLDEPTSHLDIESIEILEHLLNDFRGGFLIISHDRTFVANVSDRLNLLEDGRIKLV
jgi:ATPase subunit of ABC transporter with duplicated ATPase domains